MKKLICLLFISLNAYVNLFAQENSFTVLAVQGKIFLQKSRDTSRVELITGSKINPGETITAGSNSYAGLLFSNGSAAEIKKEGVYNFEQLKKSIKTGLKSSNRKFAEYMVGQLTKNVKDSYDMKLTGAVVRKRAEFIEIGIPYLNAVIDSNLVFKWYPYSKSSVYIFKIINSHDVTLFMKSTADTSLNCDINSLHLNRDENYKWVVFDYKNPAISSDSNYIILPPPSDVKALKDSVEQMNSVFTDDSSAVTRIIYASFYRNNNLNIEALNSYKKAVELAPDVDIYKKMYADFLIRMKLHRMLDYTGVGR